MRKVWILALAVGVVGLMAATDALAKGKKAKKEIPPVASDVYTKYDMNVNGTIDADEKATLLADFAKDKEDALLKPLDTNSDGKLSDEEIAAIPATKTIEAPAADGKKHRKGRKNK